jgi:DNA-binding GntR family transcriptional regulator
LSRTPIRESLRRLQSEGLVEVIPHRGARVVEWNSFDVEGIYDLRALIEAFVVERAATRLDLEQIEHLSELCDQMEQLTIERTLEDVDTLSTFAELNDQFHSGIASAAGADYVIPARRMLVVLPVILQALHNYAAVDIERSNAHHRELLDALRARDPKWASSVMTSHVLSSKARLMMAIRGAEGPVETHEVSSLSGRKRSAGA